MRRFPNRLFRGKKKSMKMKVIYKERKIKVTITHSELCSSTLSQHFCDLFPSHSIPSYSFFILNGRRLLPSFFAPAPPRPPLHPFFRLQMLLPPAADAAIAAAVAFAAVPSPCTTTTTHPLPPSFPPSLPLALSAPKQCLLGTGLSLPLLLVLSVLLLPLLLLVVHGLLPKPAPVAQSAPAAVASRACRAWAGRVRKRSAA